MTLDQYVAGLFASIEDMEAVYGPWDGQKFVQPIGESKPMSHAPQRPANLVILEAGVKKMRSDLETARASWGRDADDSWKGFLEGAFAVLQAAEWALYELRRNQ